MTVILKKLQKEDHGICGASWIQTSDMTRFASAEYVCQHATAPFAGISSPKDHPQHRCILASRTLLVRTWQHLRQMLGCSSLEPECAGLCLGAALPETLVNVKQG